MTKRASSSLFLGWGNLDGLARVDWDNAEKHRAAFEYMWRTHLPPFVNVREGTLTVDDLRQELWIEFVRAVKAFQPNRNANLISFSLRRLKVAALRVTSLQSSPITMPITAIEKHMADDFRFFRQVLCEDGEHDVEEVLPSKDDSPFDVVGKKEQDTLLMDALRAAVNRTYMNSYRRERAMKILVRYYFDNDSLATIANSMLITKQRVLVIIKCVRETLTRLVDKGVVAIE